MEDKQLENVMRGQHVLRVRMTPDGKVFRAARLIPIHQRKTGRVIRIIVQSVRGARPEGVAEADVAAEPHS